MRLRGRVLAAAVLATGAVALVGGPALAAQTPAGVATPATVLPADPSTDSLPLAVSITSVSPQILEPGEDLTVTATVRNDGDTTIASPRASVRIYRYRMSSRDELARWANSGASSPIGDIAATTVLDDPLEPGDTATVRVTVPADRVRLLRTEDAWGPRGLTFDVGDRSLRRGIDRSFVLWGSASEVPTAQVGVLSSVVGPAMDPAAEALTSARGEDDEDATPAPTTTATPTPSATAGQSPTPEPTGATPTPTAVPGSDGEDESGTGQDAVEPDDALTTLTAAGGRLSRVLQATADFPFVSWALDPALIEDAASGSRAARAWLTGLTDAAEDREVLRLPWADPDLAAIAHAGDADAAGTDLLDLALGVTNTSEVSPLWQDATPVLWSADDVPDQVTATRAAGSGGGAPLVVGPGALPADDSAAPSAPTTVGTTAGALVALAPDPTLTALLTDPSAAQPTVTPASVAQRILAETAVLARSDDADSTYVLAATPRDWEPSAALAVAGLSALEDAPWVDTVSVADMLAAHAAGRAGGDGAQRAGLPATERNAAELTPAWVNALSADWRAASEFASVVDHPDALLDGLDEDLLAPLAVAWRADPDGRAAAVNLAHAETTARQSGLSVLLSEQFTVISSSAQINVAVRNDLDQSARVRVELRPQKGCLDTTRSAMTEVPANAETPVTLTLRATATCEVTVDVSLVSETGRELATPVTFSARVAPTIESVGGIVIGVLLALALAFGIWRTVRRGQTTRRGARVAPDAEGASALPGPGGDDTPTTPDAPDLSGPDGAPALGSAPAPTAPPADRQDQS